jgi:DNA-binding response OmpR family regulator
MYTIPMSGYTLLVVDDEPALRMVLNLALKADGHTVHLASDGQEAMDLLHGGLMPDALVLDNNMPNKTGIEVCREVRQNSAWDDIALIMLTAADDEKTQTRADDAGVDTLIPKALRNAELRSRVRAAVDKKKGIEPSSE